MDTPVLNRQEILSQFDNLQKSGQLLWTPSTMITRVVDKGFQPPPPRTSTLFPRLTASYSPPKFEFRVCPSQSTKPAYPEDPPTGTTSRSSYSNADLEKTVPGLQDQSQSDIDRGSPEWHITFVGHTHRLIHNKYCIYRPQYILLTNDPTNLQSSPLEASDFHAAWLILKALASPHYVIFNCARPAGGSRLHKHMQIFEQDHPDMLPDRILRNQDTPVPFKYFLSPIVPCTASMAYEIYKGHVNQCAAALSVDRVSDDIVSHNVVLTKKWIISIPRRQAGIGSATANAAGFMGLVWVPNESVVKLWGDLGPSYVLASLGIPPDQ